MVRVRAEVIRLARLRSVWRVFPVLWTLMIVTLLPMTPAPASALARQVALSRGIRQNILSSGVAGLRLPDGCLRRTTRRPRPLPFTPQLSGEWRRNEPSTETPVGMGVYGGGRLIGGWRGYRAGMGVRLDLIDESFFAIDLSASGWWGGPTAGTVRFGLTRRF